jgi:hypothetical protein
MPPIMLAGYALWMAIVFGGMINEQDIQNQTNNQFRYVGTATGTSKARNRSGRDSSKEIIDTRGPVKDSIRTA